METMLDRLQYYKAYRDKMDKKEAPLENYLPELRKCEFPTLYSLTELQQSKGEDPRDPNFKSEPFPPRRRKEELISSLNFTDIDAWATSVEPMPSEDWVELGQKLFELCRSDLAKLRAAFRFTCTNRELPQVDDETQAYTDIRMRKYSKVFHNLVRRAKLPCKRIVGYKKSADIETGWRHPEKPNGDWHACYVEGEWRFVDAHWGAASVKNLRSGCFAEPDAQGSVLSPGRSAGDDVYGCNEFFFLTDPEKMIVSHFPEGSSVWQLLARPLTLDEFEQMPHYFDGSEYAMDLCYRVEPLNYPQNVILAGGPGPLEIFFKVPADVGKLDFDAKATPEACKGVREIPVRRDTLGFKQDVLRLTFDPPHAGKFQLVVRLRRSQSCWARFLTYIVHCPRAEEAKDQPCQTQLSAKSGCTGAPSIRPPAPITAAPKHQLEVSRESLATLRSYRLPPDAAFNSVRAMLLMLGFYEKRSRMWKRCLPLITTIPQAVKDLVLSSVDPRIAARSREILNVSPETESNLANLNDASHAFYRWVELTTRDIMEATPEGEFKPASMELQRKLCGIIPEEDGHWDWEDSLDGDEIYHQFLGFCRVCHIAVYSNELKMHLHCCVTRNSGRHTART